MKTFDEIYILDLHGNSLKRETTPEGGKDENVFDIRQGVAIALFVRNKEQKDSKIYHADLYGLRQEKYDWLDKNEFLKENYLSVKPQTPYYFLKKHDTETIKKYLDWKKINEIFPLNGVGMTTARDNFVIDFDRFKLENRIRLFKNSKFDDEDLHNFFQINKKKGWNIRKAWEMLQSISDIELKKYILTIAYRPFCYRYIFWHDSVVWRTVRRVMYHMLKKNIGIMICRQISSNNWTHSLISENLVDNSLISNRTKERTYIFPLYLYPDEKNKNLFNHTQIEKVPNITPLIFEKLSECYNKKPTPEEILYYIYGIFYSNIYRETYAEFLKIDFPRVPFTSDYDLFIEMGKLGKELTALHLLKSSELDSPIAKYQGSGDNDRIEKVIYKEDEQHIYINKEKYFEGVTSEVWNYYIGGYQVLRKYLKDRKDRMMDDAPRYCRIVTALYKTIEIQKQIDNIYPEIEKNLVSF